MGYMWLFSSFLFWYCNTPLQGLCSNPNLLYGNCPKSSYTNVWYKIVYANSGNPDQTIPEEQSAHGLHLFAIQPRILWKKCKKKKKKKMGEKVRLKCLKFRIFTILSGISVQFSNVCFIYMFCHRTIFDSLVHSILFSFFHWKHFNLQPGNLACWVKISADNILKYFLIFPQKQV